MHRFFQGLGLIFVGTLNHGFYAVNTTNGATVWSYSTSTAGGCTGEVGWALSVCACMGVTFQWVMCVTRWEDTNGCWKGAPPRVQHHDAR